jgi:hypothetical protein
MQKKLLILDLDETLVFATERLYQSGTFGGQYFVYKRPGLDRFIEFSAFQSYSLDLVRFEVAGIDPSIFQHPNNSNLCGHGNILGKPSRIGNIYWIKDLKKPELAIASNILVIDDSRRSERSYGNHIVIPSKGTRQTTSLVLQRIYWG